MQAQSIAFQEGFVNSDTPHLEEKVTPSTTAEVYDLAQGAAKRMYRLRQQWLDLIWESEITDNAKVVARALAGFINPAGVAWPTESTIGERCRKKERSVRRAISELRTAGLIHTKKAWFKGPLEYRLKGTEALDKIVEAFERRAKDAKAGKAAYPAKLCTPIRPDLATKPLREPPRKDSMYGKKDSQESQSSIIPFVKDISRKNKEEELVLPNDLGPSFAIGAAISNRFGCARGYIRSVIVSLPEKNRKNLYGMCNSKNLTVDTAIEYIQSNCGFDAVSLFIAEAREVNHGKRA